jgi:cysteinyl-tRNA synthetase
MRYLGETFDIHGGGQDNRFPHHEDEIAQSEGATGKPFARYWMHNGLVTINGQKMGKSLGNYISLKELFGRAEIDERRKAIVGIAKAYDPLVVRYLILQNHYGSNLDVSEDNLHAAGVAVTGMFFMANVLDRVAQTGAEGELSQEVAALVVDFRTRFTDALNEDFNTAAALAAMNKLLKNAFSAASSSTPVKANASHVVSALRELGGDVLGVYPTQADLRSYWEAEQRKATRDGRLLAVDEERGRLIKVAVDARDVLRKQGADLKKLVKKKDAAPPPEAVGAAGDALFAASDALRAKLAELGITLEDTPAGTQWKTGR